MRWRAASHVARAPSTIGYRSRVSSPKVSPSADPLEQRRPKFAGWLLSPVIAIPPALSGVATTPQPTPQYGHVVLTPGAAVWAFISRRPSDNGVARGVPSRKPWRRPRPSFHAPRRFDGALHRHPPPCAWRRRKRRNERPC